MTHGLLLGKFYPPTIGHHAVIRAAAERCDELSVVVMAARHESITLADRVAWLAAEHAEDPRVGVVGIACDAPMDLADESVWRAQLALVRAALQGRPVDVVVAGESYGPELARRLGAELVAVDRSVSDGSPISASRVRDDLAGNWDLLAPATQAGLATRIVALGAESTGTTTVSRQLADHYRARGGVWARTGWIGEYGRERTADKIRESGRPVADLVWDREDFDVIRTEQARREQVGARAGSPLLVCDTDAFTTGIWERRYLGSELPEKAARTPSSRCEDDPGRRTYLLTDHEGVAWVDDGLREGDLAVRAAMTGWCCDALTAAGRSWVLLTGSAEERLALAIRTTDLALRRAATLAPGMSEAFSRRTDAGDQR